MIDFENGLTKLIEKYMEDSFIPGVGVGIVKDNEVVFAGGFGVKDVNTKEPVTAQSLFHMASVSKTFVAVAIMQLSERGILDINKPVVEYLPYFKMDDDRYRKITIQHMLSHVSGMPDVEDYEWDNPSYDDEALERNTRNASDLSLLFEPGEKAMYSNLAFDILGDLISKCSGMSFERYIKDNILNPLGMSESSFLHRDLSRDLLTSPHEMGSNFEGRVCNAFPYNRMHAPSSTLCSSPIEMCCYALAVLNRGNFRGKRIFTTKSYETMTTPRSKESDDFEIGLSWFMQIYDGVKTIGHSGLDDGFTSNLLIQPDRGTAVVVMLNCDYASATSLSKAILDFVNGHDPKPVKINKSLILLKKIKDGGVQAAKNEFILMKSNHNDNDNDNEDILNYLGHMLLSMKRIDDAIEILELAISEYPNSSNLHESLGEFYLEKGNKESAILNYIKAVELDENNTQAMDVLREITQ